MSEIGLWLANGKIWIKGLILTGIVTKSSPSFGVRISSPSRTRGTRKPAPLPEIRRKHHQGLPTPRTGYLAQMKR
jgi:hypothetical protein